MSLKRNILKAAAVAVALSVCGSATAAFAQGSKGLDAFVGRWQMNMTKTQMKREGPTGVQTVRDPTFTWQFTPQAYGLKMEVFTKYPQPAPTRTMTVITDGKKHPCEGSASCLTSGGKASEQFYEYYKINDHMLARLFYDKGEVVEYSHYSVSKDGKTFVSVSWSPDTPEYHNIQVFDKK